MDIIGICKSKRVEKLCGKLKTNRCDFLVDNNNDVVYISYGKMYDSYSVEEFEEKFEIITASSEMIKF